ncbi:hypothetical protein HU200_052842 [Digitaria exilis]|uniref:Protein kinase domain-containing protein n=1 Tax=Digitaria exilis TaxID=1010633 RepID=A0A835AQI1_9POAL|nr:hypothetical protein HU200_052842 [Digitaria exilis]
MNVLDLIGAHGTKLLRAFVMVYIIFMRSGKLVPLLFRDLKPANILLSHNMTPKIADFGLSRLFGEEQTRTTTKNIDGTFGIITKELDIFSLGVIIIEIMTGLKHYPYSKDETSSQGFIELILEKWRNRLDNTPGNTSRETDCQQIRRCIEIGLLCVKYDRSERPTIYQIIKKLAWGGAECSNEKEVIRSPKTY